MTDRALCFQCIKDAQLRSIVKREGEPHLCESCGSSSNNAFSYEQLGRTLDPVIRQHFALGPTVRRFAGEDDEKGEWHQVGDSIEDVVQEVLGQEVDDLDALVGAVMDAEGVSGFLCVRRLAELVLI